MNDVAILGSGGPCVLPDSEGHDGGEWVEAGWHVCCSLTRTMKDVVLVLATIGFFAVAWAYTRALDRL
jgi:hypothetical protein